MREYTSTPVARGRGRARLTLLALLAASLAGLPSGVLADDHAEPDGARVVASDGTTRGIDAIDPGNRVEGILALYTSDFGASTGTNEFGAEAVLEPDAAGQDSYVVTDVCTVWDFLEGVCSNSGDNPIPEDGFILSASPGGDDPRTFIRDHLAVGDVVTVDLPVLRGATTTLDVTDPTAETNPDGVDPGSGECYPGCRGTEQMIRYTPAFGESTGTNQFGYEAVVVDDRVVARGGADNAIPDDGFVLSGHGSRGVWLATNATIGALVEVDGDRLAVSVDVGSYVIGAEQAIARTDADLTTARTACLSIDDASATSGLATATDELSMALEAEDDGDEAVAVEFAQAAERSAEQAWYATRTTRPLETRGVWVRPEEESPAAIADTVTDLADAGFTTIYLETFFQGYTIFPSETAASFDVEAQRPQFAHFDPLEVWVEEAHAQGLELHTWVHSFFVGNDAIGAPGPILSVHPEWAAVERSAVGADTPQPSTAEAGYYFVDPSIPEAREYLHGVFDEMVTEYDVDGLHLDYIRYPVSLPLDVSFSYSDHARTTFAAEFGVDPYDLDTDDPAWEDWNEWRRAQVTSFVAETHERLSGADRDVVLSAAVFPDRFDAEERKLQDWASWSEIGIIDLLAGMSFGGSPERNAVDTTTMLDATTDATQVVTGIYSPFDSLPPDTMLAQIDAVRAAGAHGVALFAYNQLSDRQAAALGAGPFRDGSVSTDVDPVASTITGLTELRERVGGVHAPCLGNGTVQPLTARVSQVIGALERAAGERGNADVALRQAERQLDATTAWLDGRIGSDATALAAQLDEELTRAADVVRYLRAR